MPFQSEKQRRYLHANHPEIANRWEAKYGLGGIAELNSQLNQLPEYYLPKNQGGFIPSHEAGIYGLAEGGNIRLQPHTASDLLVQKTSSGERPKYQPPGHGSGENKSGSSSSSGPGPGGQGARGQATQNPGTSSSPSKSPGHPSNQSFGSTKTTTTTSTGDNGRSQALINISKQKKRPTYTGTEDLEEQLVVDKQIALKKLDRHKKGLINLSKNERENLEVGLGFRSPKKAFSFGSFLKNAALTVIPGLLPAKLATAWKVGKGVYDYQKGNYDKYLPDQFKSTGNFATTITATITENAEKMKTHQKKMDLYKALPEGHPERIALQAELEIGKKPEHLGGNGDGANIKIENIEEVNDAKATLNQRYKEMDEASYAAWLRQQELEAKKQAYLRNFRETYLSAQGGRVPGGYNTGGLSNLFRLKNV